jgi:hypothetical protein
MRGRAHQTHQLFGLRVQEEAGMSQMLGRDSAEDPCKDQSVRDDRMIPSSTDVR